MSHAFVPNPSAEDIHGRLKEVFARPEFSAGDSHKSFVEWLIDALKWLGGLRQDNPALFWILLVACVGLLILLLAHLFWTVRSLFSSGQHKGRAPDSAAERQRLSQAACEQARQAAGRAEYTEAVRYLFLAVLYRFDEKGRVRFQRASTNREYLDSIEDPRLRSELTLFVDTLDENWYGQHPTQEARYRDCLEVYQNLIHA
jgi:hypothetical protein